MSDPTTTATDLPSIAADQLETVSGGSSDTLTTLLSQITSSLKDLGYNHGNTSNSDMMMMMMVMMGGGFGGGGGGGGFYFHGGFGGGFGGGGCGPALPPIDCCPPCKGW